MSSGGDCSNQQVQTPVESILESKVLSFSSQINLEKIAINEDNSDLVDIKTMQESLS